MDSMQADRLVEQLAAGFDALQDEYQKLFGQNSALERKLATAREQYNELAKLYRDGTERTATPPLSLTTSPAHSKELVSTPKSVAEILDRSADSKSKAIANKIRTASIAANALRHAVPVTPDTGVKIWSGPAADRPEGSSSLMPSIAESDLEQDFTVKGKPSQLGCPFASMAQKKLSSHAASVLSRYNQNGSVGTASTPDSNTSRVNGRESLSRRQSRRASMLDPIKAEICVMSDHMGLPADEKVTSGRAFSKGPTERPIDSADQTGVCPIRFLDQHSPEEVATYFEKHKHELPRSHEVCVMRYQSNEEQIKQLDEKYGNLVSMIQGLGQKHKEMLPEEPVEDEEMHHDAVSDEKIRKWASSVSAQAPAIEESEGRLEERLPHFERPVREIRVGESPSRPWGISVPAKYLDAAGSNQSSKPVQIRSPAPEVSPQEKEAHRTDAPPKPSGKCPFDHTALAQGPAGPSLHKAVILEAAARYEPAPPIADGTEAKAGPEPNSTKTQGIPIIINGPVFLGYSAEDAMRVLREGGFHMSS